MCEFREQEDDWATPSLRSSLDRSFDFPACLTGLDRLSTVVLPLAPRETDFDLGMSALGEVYAERNQRKSLLLGLADQFVDFFPMQQQLSGPGRIMVHNIPVAIGTDVALMQKEFALADGGVTVLQVHASFPEGLHFRPLEHDAGFKLLFDEIIVVGLPIGRHHLLLIV